MSSVVQIRTVEHNVCTIRFVFVRGLITEIIGRIRLVKFRPTILGSAHFRTVKMLLTEAGQTKGKFCPRSNGKHGDTTNKFNLFN